MEFLNLLGALQLRLPTLDPFRLSPERILVLSSVCMAAVREPVGFVGFCLNFYTYTLRAKRTQRAKVRAGEAHRLPPLGAVNGLSLKTRVHQPTPCHSVTSSRDDVETGLLSE